MGHLIQKFRFQDAINKSSKPRKRVLLISRDLHNCTIKPEVGALYGKRKGGWNKEQGAGKMWASWTADTRERWG